MLETLLSLLKLDLPSPEISLAEDGDVSLEWLDGDDLFAWVHVGKKGNVNWAIHKGPHGYSYNQLVEILQAKFSPSMLDCEDSRAFRG